MVIFLIYVLPGDSRVRGPAPKCVCFGLGPPCGFPLTSSYTFLCLLANRENTRLHVVIRNRKETNRNQKNVTNQRKKGRSSRQSPHTHCGARCGAVDVVVVVAAAAAAVVVVVVVVVVVEAVGVADAVAGGGGGGDGGSGGSCWRMPLPGES